MILNSRLDIGKTLAGDVLEIGPGVVPFPTAPGARVKYADRSVDGGRDANWPELVGLPPGVNADFNLSLDVDNLSPVSDTSLDALVAAHVIEHLANPIKAIREFERVLRPGGKLVIVVPDRTRTFDSVRAPTEFLHVLKEFNEGITEVDDAHIIEFCQAIYKQKPIHPKVVREWHNPEKLNDELFALHRRRSIHVHCWTPEEFASLIASSIASGLMSWKLVNLYLPDDYEFGLVLERPLTIEPPESLCRRFVRDWVSAIAESSVPQVRRIVNFQNALCRDMSAIPGYDEIRFLPSSILDEKLGSINALVKSIADKDRIIDLFEHSFSWRVTAPLRKCSSLILSKLLGGTIGRAAGHKEPDVGGMH